MIEASSGSQSNSWQYSLKRYSGSALGIVQIQIWESLNTKLLGFCSYATEAIIAITAFRQVPLGGIYKVRFTMDLNESYR
jgi:hypothetical protein